MAPNGVTNPITNNVFENISSIGIRTYIGFDEFSQHRPLRRLVHSTRTVSSDLGKTKYTVVVKT